MKAATHLFLLLTSACVAAGCGEATQGRADAAAQAARAACHVPPSVESNCDPNWGVMVPCAEGNDLPDSCGTPRSCVWFCDAGAPVTVCDQQLCDLGEYFFLYPSDPGVSPPYVPPGCHASGSINGGFDVSDVYCCACGDGG